MKKKGLLLITLLLTAFLFTQCRSCGCTGYVDKSNKRVAKKDHHMWYKK